MRKSTLLINEPPLQVSPSLAVAIGLNEAIILQQIHYWLENSKNEGRIDEEGNKWVYNTYAEWREGNFPFWSEDQVKRYFLSLEQQGVLISAQLDAKRRDMRKFYRVNYDLLCTMEQVKFAPSNRGNLHDVKMNQRLPENTNKVFSKSEMEEITESANKEVDGILASSKGSSWKGRELLRDNLLPLADWYNKVTGQEMTKRVQKSWWKALSDWQDEALTPEHLQIAFDTQSTWRMVSDPNQLTKDAVAVKASGGKPIVKVSQPERSSMLRTIS